jgi:hypothetical protein
MADWSDNPMELLNAAVTAKAAVSVVNADGSGQSISAQFVAHAKPGDPGVIWATPNVKHAATAKSWAAIKARVSVRYSVGQINAGAEAVIIKAIRDYWLTETLPISAFLLQEPTKVWVDQREHTRYQLRNDGGGIRVTLARTDREGTEGERKSKVIGPEARAALWDLGLGGAGFICPFNRSLVETAANEAFEVTINFAGRKAVLPGVCTYARAKGNLLRIGIKFEPANAPLEAMILLNQVIAELEKRAAQWERRSA